MTEEEIGKLARECVEDFRKDALQFFPRPLPDSMEVLIQDEQNKVAKAFQWLSKDYCIVSKSKLQEINNLVCGTFSIENIVVRQSWEYIKRKLFNYLEK